MTTSALPTPAQLRNLASQTELLYTVARRAVEDELIEMRDSRLSIIGRNNGLVVKEYDGTSSDIIRLTIESALKIGLEALSDHLKRFPQ